MLDVIEMLMNKQKAIHIWLKKINRFNINAIHCNKYESSSLIGSIV